MQRFHVVEEGAVIVRSKGIFRQAKLYRRGDDLYAGHSGGFIGLRARGGTTLPNVSWEEIEAPFEVVEPAVGAVSAAKAKRGKAA